MVFKLCPSCGREVHTLPTVEGERFRVHTGRWGIGWCEGSRKLVRPKGEPMKVK